MYLTHAHTPRLSTYRRKFRSTQHARFAGKPEFSSVKQEKLAKCWIFMSTCGEMGAETLSTEYNHAKYGTMTTRRMPAPEVPAFVRTTIKRDRERLLTRVTEQETRAQDGEDSFSASIQLGARLSFCACARINVHSQSTLEQSEPCPGLKVSRPSQSKAVQSAKGIIRSQARPANCCALLANSFSKHCAHSFQHATMKGKFLLGWQLLASQCSHIPKQLKQHTKKKAPAS